MSRCTFTHILSLRDMYRDNATSFFFTFYSMLLNFAFEFKTYLWLIYQQGSPKGRATDFRKSKERHIPYAKTSKKYPFFPWQYHIATQSRFVIQVSSTTNAICLRRYKILFTINNTVYFWLSCPFLISLKK